MGDDLEDGDGGRSLSPIAFSCDSIVDDGGWSMEVGNEAGTGMEGIRGRPSWSVGTGIEGDLGRSSLTMVLSCELFVADGVQSVALDVEVGSGREGLEGRSLCSTTLSRDALSPVDVES